MIVLLNTLTLALDGVFTSDIITTLFSDANLAFTIIFTVEMGLKIIGLGPFGNNQSYFSIFILSTVSIKIIGYVRDLMNVFDAVIVIISIMEAVFDTGSAKAISAFRSARVLRTFRVLRVTRLLRSLAFMKIIIGVISRSFKSFMSIAFLIFIMLFIYLLLGMQLLGGNLNVQTSRSNYDSLFQAFLATFQVMITENWNNILQTIFASSINKWVGMLYLSSWVVIGNWILLNLFLAIILDEFTNEDAKRDLKELDEANEIDEEEDAQLYSQYMAMSGSGSQIQSGNVSKTGSLNSHSANKRSGNTNPSSLHNKSSERNLSEEDFDPFGTEDQDKAPKKKPLYHGVDCEDSFLIFKKSNLIRIFLYKVYTHSHFENVIMAAIVASSLKLAIETYFPNGNTVLSYFDYIFNIFFAVEMLIKTISLGFVLDRGSYLQDNWNVLDGFIVTTSLIDMSLPSVNISFIKVTTLSVLLAGF